MVRNFWDTLFICLTFIGDLRYKTLLIQEINKSRHQQGLCMRISASKNPMRTLYVTFINLR